MQLTETFFLSKLALEKQKKLTYERVDCVGTTVIKLKETRILYHKSAGILYS